MKFCHPRNERKLLTNEHFWFYSSNHIPFYFYNQNITWINKRPSGSVTVPVLT